MTLAAGLLAFPYVHSSLSSKIASGSSSNPEPGWERPLRLRRSSQLEEGVGTAPLEGYLDHFQAGPKHVEFNQALIAYCFS